LCKALVALFDISHFFLFVEFKFLLMMVVLFF
jgi:hypothetical protein